MMSLFDQLYRLSLSQSGDRALRFPTQAPVQVVTSSGRPLVEGRSVNISRTGLLVEFQGDNIFRFSQGQLIHLVIEPDARYFDAEITGCFRIARVLIRETSFLLGIDFTVDPDYRKKA